ncbi:hypothetical protein DFH08DRAFT_1002807 [Mycena albidolilacea]|uniref:Uncharacterized protein n=1 Tax=Mycena albidolilacea TaxID=1033008 RepID=A0AAD7AQI8_9AGAR|nr:hypothetical protein DFH08DRAFT_1002807 [Mycena albidolilacea]
MLVTRVLAGIIAQFTFWRFVYYFAVGVQYLVLVGGYFIIPDYPAKNQHISYRGMLSTMAKFAYTEPILVQACLVTLASQACSRTSGSRSRSSSVGVGDVSVAVVVVVIMGLDVFRQTLQMSLATSVFRFPAKIFIANNLTDPASPPTHVPDSAQSSSSPPILQRLQLACLLSFIYAALHRTADGHRRGDEGLHEPRPAPRCGAQRRLLRLDPRRHDAERAALRAAHVVWVRGRVGGVQERRRRKEDSEAAAEAKSVAKGKDLESGGVPEDKKQTVSFWIQEYSPCSKEGKRMN